MTKKRTKVRRLRLVKKRELTLGDLVKFFDSIGHEVHIQLVPKKGVST